MSRPDAQSFLDSALVKQLGGEFRAALHCFGGGERGKLGLHPRL